MPTESGDMKLLGNFRILIDHVTADTNYQPANNDLKVPALEAQYTAAAAASGEISAKMAPYKVAINERQTAYDELDPIVIRARNMLKASGADKQLLADAETHLRKLLGRRKSPKAKDNPATPQDESKASHSASQLSFDNRAGNFDSFVSILANVAEYNPNENDLKLASLQAQLADLNAKNNAVSSTFVLLSQARGTRDQLLYLSDNSVVNIALLVKAYVNAAFGSQSQLNKQIKGLKFDRAQK